VAAEALHQETPDIDWARLSESIARITGLHFPAERQADLYRGLSGVAKELGFDTIGRCARWLLSAEPTPRQLQVLASHLTIGETYFFRERKVFDALAEHVIPELMQRHRRDRQLRFWSAGCCTGEEPYSLAILLQQCIPDLQDWRISILATDINARFLQKAATGIYGEWSFRDTPASFRERYFTRTPEGRYALLPKIRQRVRFAPLNLASDTFPSLATETQAMDLIFCRNTLMYFTPPQAEKAIGNLRRSLLDNGWFLVSGSESSHTLYPGFTAINFPGAILYRKNDGREPAPVWIDTPRTVEPPSFELADSLYKQGDYEATSTALMASIAPDVAPEPPVFSLLARSLANQGKLQEALDCCDRWVAAAPLESSARYLRAVVLEELGNREEARRSLQQALYLQPDFVLAHFALGNLARSNGEDEQARRHFRNTVTLLKCFPPEDILPESDGLTAGRLQEIVQSLITLEAAA
jgi:chemotaxis protein methyltransferase CheR